MKKTLGVLLLNAILLTTGCGNEKPKKPTGKISMVHTSYYSDQCILEDYSINGPGVDKVSFENNSRIYINPEFKENERMIIVKPMTHKQMELFTTIYNAQQVIDKKFRELYR